MSTFSPLATEILPTHQKSSRRGAKPTHIVLHHAATTSLAALDRLVAGAREVSAHLGVKDTEVHAYVPEEERAWSLASEPWDARALTVEACNSKAGGSWPLSGETHETLARIVADWCRRYSIPCTREHVIGHREVYTRHGASYATACPGGMDLERIVARAAVLLSEEVSKPKPKPRPTATSAPPFPLPKGWYIGPRSGPIQSVSGYHGRREVVRAAQQRMADRGWDFSRYGIDGLYGDEFRENIIAFQREKNLKVDGLLGVETWNALWTEPVTEPGA